MGYYTKHIIKIKSDHTDHDLARLSNLIGAQEGHYHFDVYPEIDCIDDRTWNDGEGAKFYSADIVLEKVSKTLKDVEFVVYSCTEDGERYVTTYLNGLVDEEYIDEIMNCDFDDEDFDDEEKFYDISHGLNPKTYDQVYDTDIDENENYIIKDYE